MRCTSGGFNAISNKCALFIPMNDTLRLATSHTKRDRLILWAVCVCVCSENEKEATVKWIFQTCKIKWAFQRFTFDFVPMQYAYRLRSIFFLATRNSRFVSIILFKYYYRMRMCAVMWIMKLFNQKFVFLLSSGFLAFFVIRYYFCSCSCMCLCLRLRLQLNIAIFN